ncbi:MAG: hypothetical protein AB4372_08125 [Xenococcus sp. (in: cyanobacteria)]
MNDSNSKWKKTLKIVLPILTIVAGYFGYTFEAKEAEQPTSSPSATNIGLEGGIHIYPPQFTTPQSTIQLEPQYIPTEQKEEIAQTTINQETNGDGNCPSIVNGDNNSVSTNCSKTEEIENKTDNTRNIQAEQYIEKPGDNNTNCVGNENSACGNGTFNINPR